MYVGEPGENDALVQRDAGHFGERAVPRAGNRGHGWRIGDRACGQQVTLQLNNPLVTANLFFFVSKQQEGIAPLLIINILNKRKRVVHQKS